LVITIKTFYVKKKKTLFLYIYYIFLLYFISKKDDVNIWDKLSPSFVEHLNQSASVIQKWYRAQIQRRELLNEKKKELLSSFGSSYRTLGKKSNELIVQKINLKEKNSKVSIAKKKLKHKYICIYIYVYFNFTLIINSYYNNNNNNKKNNNNVLYYYIFIIRSK